MTLVSLKNNEKTDSYSIFRSVLRMISFTLILILMFFSHSAVADEIHLKNGRIIKTSFFWEDGSEIVFEKYGNTVGVLKKSVKEIRSTHFESASIDAATLSWKDPVLGMEFKWVPAGCFNRQDSNAGAEDKECLNGFWMGIYEVTNAQFRQFSPGHTSGSFISEYSLNDDRQPAVYISGEDAQAFAAWLTSENAGNFQFRLPREAEWEFACQAGTDTAFFWGNDADQACNYGNLKDIAWRKISPAASETDFFNCYDGYIATSPVGSFAPNAFGLHDTIGNAAEWCIDQKVLRGSAFDTEPNLNIGGQRFDEQFNAYNHWVGFRLVMSKKKTGRFETVNLQNEYGGKTERAWKPGNDDFYESGVQEIFYFYNAGGNLERRELHYNPQFATVKGVYKKIVFTDRHEIILTEKSASEKGFKRIILYSKIDRRMQMWPEDWGGPE
jgi:formylglycine-generating enzyme required for sulfatase activity